MHMITTADDAILSLYQAAQGTYQTGPYATTTRQFKPESILVPRVQEFKPDPMLIPPSRLET
jgi:hypothetical protein